MFRWSYILKFHCVLVLFLLVGCEEHQIDKLYRLSEMYPLENGITGVVANVDSSDLRLTQHGAAPVVDLALTYRGTSEPDYEVVVEGTVLRITVDCDGVRFCGGEIDILMPSPVEAILETGSGGIETNHTLDTTRVTTGSGGIDIRNAVGLVEAKTGSGGIRIGGVKGNLTAETGSGGIRVAQIEGDVDLVTGSGGIEGEQLRAPFASAETGSGSIELGFDLAPALIDAQTSSGGVSIRVPSGDYAVDAETSSGSVDIVGISRVSGAPNRIVAHTSSGSIDIVGF